MINIITVDDEQLALELCEQAIQEALPDCALSCFNDPEDALAFAARKRVDIAFLDIEMPVMNGVTLAKRLKDIYPQTNIVFVTSYSEYALDSYEVKASEYLLKPISKETVLNSLHHLRYPIKFNRMRVQTFGNFEVFVDDKPLYFSRKRAKEVLAFLIYKQGSSCTVKEIAATLLEDKKGGNLHIQQDISVLMKVLKDNGVQDVVVKRHNSFAVDTEKIECDYYRALDGDIGVRRTWMGDFMANYSWAEHVVGYVDKLLR